MVDLNKKAPGTPVVAANAAGPPAKPRPMAAVPKSALQAPQIPKAAQAPRTAAKTATPKPSAEGDLLIHACMVQDLLCRRYI